MKEHVIRQIIPMYGSITRSIFLGAGLAFSIENEKYSHIPLVFFFPITYGYFPSCVFDQLT